ncbi:MAG: hypothetical protein SGBAC_000804 [Bacillariaceae sp.]
MTVTPRLLLSLATILCVHENATAFVLSPTTSTQFAPSSTNTPQYKYKYNYKSTMNDENEIRDNGNEMVKTEVLQLKMDSAKTMVDKKKKKTNKKVDPASELPLDKYHFTTNSNKELIFDQRTGRFFETSIRPGSFHQLWQEYLHDNENEKNTVNGGQPAAVEEFSNDMVPTNILFGTGPSLPFESPSSLLEAEEGEGECLVHTPYQDSCESTPLNVLDDDDDYNKEIKSSKKEKKEPNMNQNDSSSLTTIVEECYKAWNQRDMKAAANCFTSSSSSSNNNNSNKLEYRDAQYLGKITSRQELEDRFTQQANLLPLNCKIVLDHLAHNVESGKIATQWHVENKDGATVKFTKGCSFYTLDKESGLIQSGFRASEMVIKPNRNTVNALLSLVPSLGSSATIDAKRTSEESSSTCIVQKYFDAWNRRDMEAALECLDDNCVYQTEDPVFVGTLNGKEEMREHLTQNANVLPAAAKIVLDDLAVDTRKGAFATGTIGTRWHLAVNGVALPNLQGCSMYTIDPDTGKIKTALDITEAPVKLPNQALPFLGAPAAALFG